MIGSNVQGGRYSLPKEPPQNALQGFMRLTRPKRFSTPRSITRWQRGYYRKDKMALYTVYQYQHRESGKIYVGVTNDLARRGYTIEKEMT